jgi:hypothetical protein
MFAEALMVAAAIVLILLVATLLFNLLAAAWRLGKLLARLAGMHHRWAAGCLAVVVTAVLLSVFEPQSGDLRGGRSLTQVEPGSAVPMPPITSLQPAIVQAQITIVAVDPVGGAAEISIELLGTRSLAEQLTYRGSDGRWNNAWVPGPQGKPILAAGFPKSRQAALQLLRLGRDKKSTSFSITAINVAELLETVAPPPLGDPNFGTTQPVVATTRIPVRRTGMFPIEHYSADLRLVLVFTGDLRLKPGPAVFVEPTVTSTLFAPRLVSLGELPAATTWSLVPGQPSLRGWRPSVLVIYTLLLSLAPGIALLLLLTSRATLAGAAWDAIAALIAVLALRSVLIPEGAPPGPTAVDVLLGLQVVAILITYRASSSRQRTTATPATRDEPTRAPHGERIIRLGVWTLVLTRFLRDLFRVR